MKAFIYTKYVKPVFLKLSEAPKPAPNDDQVLVKVFAASVNAYDWHFLTADIFVIRFVGGALTRPKINTLGADLAGVVEAVGKNITRFKPGDAVFGEAVRGGGGSFGEYVVVPEKNLALKPENVSFEEAAAVTMAGSTALQGLRDDGRIQPGQKVLIQGASGGVGTFALQIAKTFGAEVTAVCSTRNLDQARQLGADYVIDYTKEDFTKNGQQYDLIFAANGYHSLSAYKRALKPNGIYVMAGGKPGQMFQAVTLGSWMSRGEQKFKIVSADIDPKDLDILAEMLSSGKIKSVIDRVFPFDQTPEAVGYLGAGHARGKVVISLKV